MKVTRYFFTLLFIGALLTSCEKEGLNYQNDYEKSYKEWLSFKETSGNSYRYMVTGSSWVGSASQTVITVTNGKVTQRQFKYISVPGLSNVPPDAMEWTEKENEINTNAYSGAAASPLTLDQIYDIARSEWLIKRDNAKAYFEKSNNGLISSCGYVEDGCMDDCFMGIRIAYIVSL